MRPENAKEEESLANKKQYKYQYFWCTKYLCERSGNKRDKIAEGRHVEGGISSKPRSPRKPSKKINCNAKLKIIAYRNNPGFVEFIHIEEHNHKDTNEVLNFLPQLQIAINRYNANPWPLNEEQLEHLKSDIDVVNNLLNDSVASATQVTTENLVNSLSTRRTL